MKMIEKIRSGLRRNNDNRGMSLVEILCAVAIFSIVAATVSGIVVVSSRLYNRGVTQTSLQQQAQYIANQVGYIVKGANDFKAYNTGEYSGFKVVMAEKSGSYIGFKDNALYYNLYSEDDAGNVTFDSTTFERVAENIASFDILPIDDTDAVRIKISLANGSGTYDMDYTMTPRNEVVQNINFSNIPVVGIDCENNITLVPGETYNLVVDVTGDSGGINVTADAGVTVTDSSGHNATSADYPQIGSKITIPVNIDDSVKESSRTITIKTHKTIEGTTTAVKTLIVKFNIRRVNSITVAHDADWKNTSNYTYEAAGSVFTFYASVSAFNVQKSTDSWDDNWKQPTAVEWTAELTIGGVSTPVSEYFEELERVEIPASSFDPADPDKYKKQIPQIKYKLKKDMPANLVFTVKAASRHRRGENKSGSEYCDTSGNYDDIYGTDTIKPRDAKLAGTSYMVLEPNEDGTVSTSDISVLGGIPELAFTINGAKDSDTTVELVGDEIKVHLGTKETGTDSMYYKNKDGGSSKGNGIIKIYIHAKDASPEDINDQGAVLYVFVRRVTEITLDYKIMHDEDDPTKYPVTEPLKKGTVYQFRTNVRGTNMENLWFEEGKPQVEDDVNEKLADTDYCKRFGVEFEWMVIQNGDEDNPVMKGKTFWISKDQNEKSVPVYTEPRFCAGDFENENLKVQYLNLTNKNGPHINVKLLTDFPENTEFRVTATTLNTKGDYVFEDFNKSPLNHVGSTNRTGTKYNDDYSATVSLNNVLEFNGPYPVADPTQGTIETDTSGNPILDADGKTVYSTKHVMKVPITVLAPIGKIVAYNDDSTSENVIKVLKVENCKWKEDTKKATGYVYLEVGKNAVEDKDYGIEVYAMAKKDQSFDSDTGQPNVYLAKLQIPIHIRRVTDVTVEPGKAGVNKAESKLEFVATSGGMNGQYFDIQRDDDGKICPWDEPGEGGTDYVGYMTPYAWKWSMSFDDGKTWHAFVENDKGKLVVDPADSKLTEYVKDSDSSGLEYDSKLTSVVTKRQETLTITLNKKLPEGTIIRATSLHAAGENRGGKEYADVYGEYIIKAIQDPDDPVDDKDLDYLDSFFRGQDLPYNDHGTVYKFDDNHEEKNLKEAAANSNNVIDYNKGKWFWRYREITDVKNGQPVYGEWTQYYRMRGENPLEKKLDSQRGETFALQPDKRYQIQMALMVLDNDKKILLWPRDESLITTKGTGLNDYSKGWDKSDTATPESEYSSKYNISRSYIKFDSFKSENGSDYPYKTTNNGLCVGSMSDPVVINAASGKQFKVNISNQGCAIQASHFQGSSNVRIQEYTEDGWQLLDESFKNGIELQEKCQFILIKDFSAFKKGSLYRMSLEINSGDRWCTVSGTLLEPVYTSIGKNKNYLLCGSNGTAGYIYFTVE